MKLMPTNFFLWLFRPLEPRAKGLDVLCWWERRRVAFNMMVFLWGVMGLLIFFLILPNHGDMTDGALVEIMRMVPAWALLINFCYTLGWIVAMPGAWFAPESTDRLSPLLMKWGLALTALVIAAPPMLLIVLLALERIF
jgi:hypothetical protein